MPTFSTDWLTPHLPQWETHLLPMAGKPDLSFLEIGPFEGRSTCWLLERVLTHPTSRITCVDTFEPFKLLPYANNPWPTKPDMERAEMPFEDRFDANVREAGGDGKVLKRKGRSLEVLRTLPLESYDFVYVDGSHRPQDVLRDGVLAWDLLKPGGILLFDDYLLYTFTHPYESPRVAVDAILAVFSGSYETLHAGWQMMIRKTAPASASRGEQARAQTFLERLKASRRG